MRVRNIFAVTISALLLITGASATGAAPEAKEVYLIKFADNVNLDNEIAALKAGGGEVKSEYRNIFKGAAVALNSAQANAFSKNPRIEIIEKDAVSTTQGSGIQANPVWGLDRIDQGTKTLDKFYSYNSDGEYLNNSNAARVKVYVVDTGIRTTHSQFEGRAIWGTNTIDSKNTDCNGHGTHVAGTIGSRDYGVAKKAQLVAVKVLNCSGSGTGDSLLKAFDYIVDVEANPGNYPLIPVSPARSVINMSLGFSVVVQTVDLAICKLATGTNCSDTSTSSSRFIATKPIVVVVAAGNSNANACLSTPGSAPKDSLLVVAASDSSDRKASFSNWGPCVDLFAPGVSIVSTWNNSDTATKNIQGTSMASPHVAGMAARVISASTDPSAITVSDVYAAINNGAKSAITGITSTQSGTTDKLLYGTPKP